MYIAHHLVTAWAAAVCVLQVEKVKRECLPGASGLDCPLLEEYDFAHDTVSDAASTGDTVTAVALPCSASAHAEAPVCLVVEAGSTRTLRSLQCLSASS
jgi:hypothetical protein